ncbi:hypothetical protein AB0N81_12895 [Streptomyces sp. NPDC093510]|uniref:hypothetical protein n=1 Tax=Streptomyces sp. NPDC093510 TaxID=3155199 RepID=UPI003435D75D
MSEHHQRHDEEPTWASLSTRAKTLTATAITGLGLGIAALVTLFLLLMVLIVTAACGDSIEFDGPATLLWAALLCPPCGLLAGTFTTPVRFLLRLNRPTERTRRTVEALTSCLHTFLAALFVLHFTPGLHATNPWLPAATATALGIAANLLMNRAESRKRGRPQGR